MSMDTMFDVIFSKTHEAIKKALEAHKHAPTDEEEESTIAQFLENEGYEDDGSWKHFGTKPESNCGSNTDIAQG